MRPVRSISVAAALGLATILIAPSTSIAKFGDEYGAVVPGNVDLSPREIQIALAWTGHFNGIADGQLGPRTQRAIRRWQRANGLDATGELTNDQRFMLMLQRGEGESKLGWTQFTQDKVGYTIGYPSVLFKQTTPLEYGGIEFASADGEYLLRVEVEPSSEEFQEYIDKLGTSNLSRKITYEARPSDSYPNRYVVSGVFLQRRYFYTVIEHRDGLFIGFTFSQIIELSEDKADQPAPQAIANDSNEAGARITVSLLNSFVVPDMPGSAPQTPEIAETELPAAEETEPSMTELPDPTRAQRVANLAPNQLFDNVKDSVFKLVSVRRNANDKYERIAEGSAVAISKQHLFTNCHVLEGGEIYFIQMNEVIIQASIHASKPADDQCILQVQNDLPAHVPVAKLDTVVMGQHVYAIGYPIGVRSLSDGIVSSLFVNDRPPKIQVTAPISPGSSGGGLFDEKGNLVGITTYRLREADSMNFAIAAEDFLSTTGVGD
jgi:peptidoglycan hydrolase-like protein with peptidoglycan-binding domain